MPASRLPKDASAALRLLREGHSAAEVARRLSALGQPVGHSTVRKWAIKAGTPPRKGGNRSTHPISDKTWAIAEMLASNPGRRSAQDVAEYFGLTRSRVYQVKQQVVSP